MIERYRVEAWVNRNLAARPRAQRIIIETPSTYRVWPGGLEEDFEAIVDEIMEVMMRTLEEDFKAIVDEITAVIMRRSGL